MYPEQDAVVFATTAAMLTSRKTEKSQALAQLGEALSFQFWCSMPGGFLHFSPWTELLEVRGSSCTEQQQPPPSFTTFLKALPEEMENSP